MEARFEIIASSLIEVRTDNETLKYGEGFTDKELAYMLSVLLSEIDDDLNFKDAFQYVIYP